jgi:hypothetical protein
LNEIGIAALIFGVLAFEHFAKRAVITIDGY